MFDACDEIDEMPSQHLRKNVKLCLRCQQQYMPRLAMKSQKLILPLSFTHGLWLNQHLKST